MNGIVFEILDKVLKPYETLSNSDVVSVAVIRENIADLKAQAKKEMLNGIKECATCKYHETPFDAEPCSWCGNDCRNYERG